MSDPTPTSAAYVKRLEQALTQSGMSQTKFGYLHFGDPGFLARMRKGVRLQKRTIVRIENVLDMFSRGK